MVNGPFRDSRRAAASKQQTATRKQRPGTSNQEPATSNQSAYPMRSGRPLRRIEYRLGEETVRVDFAVLLQQSTFAVHVLLHLRRDPTAAGLLVGIEPIISAALPSVLQQPHDHQA